MQYMFPYCSLTAIIAFINTCDNVISFLRTVNLIRPKICWWKITLYINRDGDGDYNYNRFCNIIEFIEIFEWINLVPRIFKHIGDVKLFCMLRENKNISNFLWIFCDVRRMKRVETLKCLASMKGLNAHAFQKLDWK